LKRRTFGFSIVEVIAALAIMVVLAAVLVPGLTRQLSTSQGSNLTADIRVLNQGIQQFRENVGRYPKSLQQLTTFPSGSTQLDICGLTIPATNVNQWRGPYHSLTLTAGANGIQSGDATIILALTRTPATTSSSTNMDGVLSFDVLSVDSVAAAEVENAIDGVSLDNSIYQTGTILWANTGGVAGSLGYVGTLTVRFPIRGC
jgi:type II secretory pathway pseudopilin PulG